MLINNQLTLLCIYKRVKIGVYMVIIKDNLENSQRTKFDYHI